MQLKALNSPNRLRAVTGIDQPQHQTELVARQPSHLHLLLLAILDLVNPHLSIAVGFLIEFGKGRCVGVVDGDPLGGVAPLILEACGGEEFFGDVGGPAESEDSIEGVDSVLIEDEVGVFLPGVRVHLPYIFVILYPDFTLMRDALNKVQLLPDKIMQPLPLSLIQLLLHHKLPHRHPFPALQLRVQPLYLPQQLLPQNA